MRRPPTLRGLPGRAAGPRPDTSPQACAQALLDVIPSWEGSPGFTPIARAATQMLQMPAVAHTPGGIDVVSAADLASLVAIAELPAARPIHIDAQQLLALPDWSEEGGAEALGTALRYAERLQLPFNPLLLDFSDARGEPCWLPYGGAELALYGALLFRREFDGPAAFARAGELAVIPFGAQMLRPEGSHHPFANPGGEVMPDRAPLGAMTVGCKRIPGCGELALGETYMEGARGSRLSEQMATLAAAIPIELAAIPTCGEIPPCAIPACVWAGTGVLISDLLAAVCERKRTTIRLDELEERWKPQILDAVSEASLVAHLVLWSLRAMFLLESVNVELAPAPVSRQVRRAAERSGGRRKLALTVHIRPPRSRSATGRRSGTRDYAYAFERRGTYRHVTRGPHAKPEQMRPCPRDDEAHRAAGGCCRLEWVPPHIVGAGEGKALILKTRRVA